MTEKKDIENHPRHFPETSLPKIVFILLHFLIESSAGRKWSTPFIYIFSKRRKFAITST